MFGYTLVATVSPSKVLEVLQEYKGCEELMETSGDDDGNVLFWLHNKAIDWDTAIASYMETATPVYEVLPQYQQSQLASETKIKATRTRRTKAEIEAAKVEPVLPDFCVNGQECNLPVAPTFEVVEPETPEVITSAATTTKARRFGRTAPVEAETTDDSNDSEVA